MNRYKAVFFDFGNTLAPENPVSVQERIRRAYDEGGFQREHPLAFPGDDDLLRMEGECSMRAGWLLQPGWADQYRAFYARWAESLLAELGVPSAVASGFAPEFAERFRDLSDRLRILFADTVPALRELRRRRRRLAIVSNNDGALLRRVRYLRLDSYFELVVDSADVRINKPDPAIFRLSLERLKLGPDDVLHVGDAYDSDVEGAASAGIATAWLNRDDMAPPALTESKPTYVIRSLMELPDIVSGKRSPYSACRRA